VPTRVWLRDARRACRSGLPTRPWGAPVCAANSGGLPTHAEGAANNRPTRSAQPCSFQKARVALGVCGCSGETNSPLWGQGPRLRSQPAHSCLSRNSDETVICNDWIGAVERLRSHSPSRGIVPALADSPTIAKGTSCRRSALDLNAGDDHQLARDRACTTPIALRRTVRRLQARALRIAIALAIPGPHRDLCPDEVQCSNVADPLFPDEQETEVERSASSLDPPPTISPEEL